MYLRKTRPFKIFTLILFKNCKHNKCLKINILLVYLKISIVYTFHLMFPNWIYQSQQLKNELLITDQINKFNSKYYNDD